MKIAVVGGGIVGLSSAYELALQGHDVTVMEKSAAGAAASAGNAGWITPFLSAPRAAPGAFRDGMKSFLDRKGPARIRPHVEPDFLNWALRFLYASNSVRSKRAMANLQQLSREAHASFDRLADQGVEFEMYKRGLAVVFKQEANLAAYEQVANKTKALGYVGETTIYRSKAATDFEPSLRPDIAGVMHLEAERHVRPESVTDGLVAQLRSGGSRVLEWNAVTRLQDLGGSGWLLRLDSGEELVVDQVVVTAGFESRDLLKQVGVRLPLEAAKGVSMTATGVGTAPTHPLKLYEDMVACSAFGDRVRLSGTFDVGDRSTTLNRKRLKTVVNNGLSYFRDWQPRDFEVQWSGHRPTSADDLPIIGHVPNRSGLYLATGHGTLGVTLGPLTGQFVASEIGLGIQRPELEPFRLDRFSSGQSARRATPELAHNI